MKKSTLIKLVKEELTKKSLLKEFDTREINRIGKLRGTLAGLIHYADNKSLEPQWLLNKISEIITKALKEDSDFSQMNEEETQDTYIVTYEIGVKGEDDDVRVQASSEEEAIEKVKSGEAKLPYGQKLSALARNFHARKVEK